MTQMKDMDTEDTMGGIYK
ncbi:hypothetical protein CLS_36940 [[Clostridium] cf. saccharolyticum K10]|nr:hypothetical protein CLS_36940 [[Clostridium] cf. saccharolyticum K10]